MHVNLIMHFNNGLVSFIPQRNSFDPSDPHYTQLSEIMFSRDPFNKQPQSASTSKDQIKVCISDPKSFTSAITYILSYSVLQ